MGRTANNRQLLTEKFTIEKVARLGIFYLFISCWLYIIYSLSPFFISGSYSLENPRIKDIISELKDERKEDKRTLMLSSLVGIVVQHLPKRAIPEKLSPYIDYGRLFIYIVITIFLRVILPLLVVLFQKSELIQKKEDIEQESIPSPEHLLDRDVFESRQRTVILDTRSTLMLIAGIAMAFVGVGFFLSFFPSLKPEENTWNLVLNVIRPAGILIFIESIAWFFLRQYRALVEDHKLFYRVYLRRVNYLIAWKMLLKEDLTDRQFVMTAALISEDLSGKLKENETTENIEGLKMTREDNSVLRLFEMVLGNYMESQKRK